LPPFFIFFQKPCFMGIAQKSRLLFRFEIPRFLRIDNSFGNSSFESFPFSSPGWKSMLV